jgi:hypothetical protein
MIETLYKTPTPEKGKSECYVLVLTSRASSGGSVYAFMEEHGQWNEDLERLLYRVHDINADERLTYQHARGLYEGSKRRLAQLGFVHSFVSDGWRQESCSDPVPQPEAAIA